MARRKWVGSTYGLWYVLARGENSPTGKVRLLCSCLCGTQRLVLATHLNCGRTKSCGCNQNVNLQAIYRHPLSGTYYNIIGRCENAGCPHYQNYGGRGIKMHPAWRDDFWQFVKDMGPKPSPTHMVERRNNDGDYEPGNCVWATPTVQMRNTRRNRLVEYDGKEVPLSAACEAAGVNYDAAKWRLNNGHPWQGIAR